MPREYDKRVKIDEHLRKSIIKMHKNGASVRAIARKLEGRASRRSIQFILFPSRYEHFLRMRRDSGYMKAYHAANYDRIKHNANMRKHRRYKYAVLKRADC